MRKKRARKSWSLPIENVPGLVLHANAKGTTLPIENVKIDPERRVIYGFVHAKHDGGSPTIERLKALDRATRRGILGLPPPAIDKKRLAERVRQGQPLREHEAQFVADLLTGKKRRAVRPKSTDVALKRDEIVQDVLYAQALHSNWKRESIIKRVQKLHRISRGFVFKVLREIDPGRRSAIEASAKAFAEWQAEVAARATAKRKK